MKFRSSVIASVVGPALALALAILVGCDRDNPSTANKNGGDARQPADPIPAGLVLTAAPQGAQDVSAVKKDAVKDKEVVVKGVIAGSKEPIAANRAIFTLADPSLETCDKMPGDTCPTPWDACCSQQDEITAKSITIQVVGTDGKPLKAPLKGVGGLAPLKQVIVKGKVRTADGQGDKKIVTLDATGIYVKS
jgi:hypothetical protein